jgi:hypothetical protein
MFFNVMQLCSYAVMQLCGYAIPQAPLSGGDGGGFLSFAVMQLCGSAVLQFCGYGVLQCYNTCRTGRTCITCSTFKVLR